MKNLFDIKDKVIIVTGGCGILGKSIANYLAEQGAKIVILDRVEEIGKELEKRLDAAHITCNKNTVPNDPRSPFVTSGVRLGTPAVTTRGMKGYDRRVYRTRTSE